MVCILEKPSDDHKKYIVEINGYRMQRKVALQMGPDPTHPEHTFDPQYKSLSRLWPNPMRFFLTRKDKNRKIWDFYGKFSKPKPKPKMADPIQPKWQKIDQTRPGSKNFDPDPLLVSTSE